MPLNEGQMITVESSSMKKLLLLATVIGATAIVPRAQAGLSFGISIGPHYPPPVYVAPPPFCGLPPVYVSRPPVCVAPAPVLVAPPVYYAPPPRVIVYGHQGYGHHSHYRHYRNYSHCR